jgi:hypothetical protein
MQELEIALLSLASHFVKPTNGIRLKTRLGGSVCWVDDFDFDFDSVIATLDPTFPFFSLVRHNSSQSRKYTVTSMARLLSDSRDQTASTSLPSTIGVE